MLIYLSVFIITFIFSLIAEKNYKKNRKKVFYLTSAFVIIIPSIIAGIRASGIGTDTQIYVNWTFNSNIKASNISEALNFADYSGIELGYCLLNYYVSRFTDNFNVIYFVLEFVFLFFSYFGCVKISKKLSISFSYTFLIFMFLFYNKSLNLCRQSIAMSICLYSLTYIIERDWKNFFLLMFVAFNFHRSVILFIPLYFVYKYCTTKNQNNKLILFLIVISILVGVLFFKQIIILLVNIGVLSNKYLNYVYKYGSGNNIKLIEIASQTSLLLLILFYNKYLTNKNEINKFLVYVTILSFVTFLIGFNATYSQRISYYYTYCSIFLLPQIVLSAKKGKDKLLNLFLSLILVFGYFYLYYGKYAFDQTFPYIIDTSPQKNSIIIKRNI